jgi:alpha-amylase
MPAVCFYFQVHQPYRVKRFRVFDIGQDHDYFVSPKESRLNNEAILQKVAGKSYIPTNRLMLELLAAHPRLRLSYSLSGVLLEQLEEFSPEALKSFQELVSTGQVEILAETYYHSLSFIFSREEFIRQVKLHSRKVKSLFGLTPKVFRNTELIYNNDLGKVVSELGFKGILAEGADHILGWRSPNYLYSPPDSQIKLLLKNYRMSDDIAFRFSNPSWSDFPLMAPKFASWISALNGSADVINLFMDYETFGEHQWVDTGIFDFLRHLPGEILKHPDNYFVTPSESVKKFPVRAAIDVPHFVSWADIERDISAWLGNPMQDDASARIYELESAVLATKNQKLISDWRKLLTSDHFYYMCTKWFADGDVHKYFNPYESPYESFIAYMNVLQDLKLRIDSYTTRSPSIRLREGVRG